MVKRFFNLVVATFLMATFILPTRALAQSADGINLQISPLPIELTTKPGTSASADLRVRNGGSKAEKLQIRLLKVSQDNEGSVHLSTPGANDEFVNWVTFSKAVFDAPAGQWQTIHMTVNVPKSAAYGYYFAVEYLRASEEAPQAGKAVAKGAVATFVLLNADAPGAKREAQLDSFRSDKKSYEFLPVDFTVKLRSTGNVHVAPHGNIFITKGGKQVGAIAVNADEGKVLPGSSRFFASSWQDGFPAYASKTDSNDKLVVDKNGKATKKLRWDLNRANRLRFGHYTAHLVMVYDNGERDVPMEATLSFWVVPWRILIGLLLVGIFVAIGLWSTFQKSAGFIKRRRKGKV